MPFGTITAQTLDYASRGGGRYVRSNLAFGSPDNSFLIRPVTNLKADPIRAAVSRILQKDITVSGNTVRKTATVTLSFVVPSSDFTATEVDSLTTDLSEFITSTTLTQLFMGDS